VVALVDDLMDRSRVSAALGTVEFVRSVEACRGADVVIVDLGRHAADVGPVRTLVPAATVVAFGSHVDEDVLAAAVAAGADHALPRSLFFHEPGRYLAR
jgi:hypothetical protein